MNLSVGDTVIMLLTVIEPACGDHPEFLLGAEGERAVIKAIEPNRDMPYLVQIVGKHYGPFWVWPREIAPSEDRKKEHG